MNDQPGRNEADVPLVGDALRDTPWTNADGAVCQVIGPWLYDRLTPRMHRQYRWENSTARYVFVGDRGDVDEQAGAK